ncbi:hypothetical protein CHS0354_024297 [Potamilus streckersoni]|uniref:CUB domain-containing protein n=1 Tax=Potamilus streckersoni TaxID=2493646 RepID=A0AAE0VFY8_9BIVA|nr:hypothetical protein CHS0354_024297 [Potamilus streckersoni]
MMEKYSILNRLITNLEKLGIILCLLWASGVLCEEILIKNDSYVSLELHNEKYVANQNRTWVLSQDSGLWALYFLHFSLEAPSPKTHVCEYDFLKIRERRNSTVHEDTFCGNQIRAGETYYSAGPKIELQFKSDDRNEILRGFEIQAFHAETKGELIQKQKQLKQNISMIETSTDPVPNVVDKRNGQTLLIIGLASGTTVVSIIFVIIFIYFLKVILKPRKHIKLHNILIAEEKSISPTGGKNVILLATGRRYSKDKEMPTCSKNIEKPGVVTNRLYYTNKCSASDYGKAKASIETRLKIIHETGKARPENLYVHSIPVQSETDSSNKT